MANSNNKQVYVVMDEAFGIPIGIFSSLEKALSITIKTKELHEVRNDIKMQGFSYLADGEIEQYIYRYGLNVDCSDLLCI